MDRDLCIAAAQKLTENDYAGRSSTLAVLAASLAALWTVLTSVASVALDAYCRPEIGIAKFVELD